MENLGKNIMYYRRSLKMTQRDLGEELNVSPQAVSKWENGQAEPDASTIKKLCKLFNITTDELLYADELAEGDGIVERAQPVERVHTVEQRIISGYCEMCKKPLSPEDTVIEHFGRSTIQHLYCRACKAKRDAAEIENRIANHKRKTVKSLIWGTVAGIAMLAFMLVGAFLNPPSDRPLLIGFGIVYAIGTFAFVMQMFWDGAVTDCFFFFLKSFRMPGVIFTLDLDGIIFLLTVKLLGAILSALLSVVLFLVGLILMPLISLVILPFAAVRRAHNKDEE